MGNDPSQQMPNNESVIVSQPSKQTSLPANLDHDQSTIRSANLSQVSSKNVTPSLTPILPHMDQSTIRSANLTQVSSKNVTPSLTPIQISSKNVTPLTPCDHLSLTSIPPKYNKRTSALLNINNGITGKHISSRICKIAATFWQQNIETLSMSDQLEIGCSIFFGMLSTNEQMKNVMKSNFSESQKIENISLRYLDMMGWLIRYLITDNIDFYSLLTELGKLHQKMGINIIHFDPMLQSMHQTFGYYFERKYNIEVKYAMDEIFSLAAQIMSGQPLKGHLNDITKQFQGKQIPFLKNLRTCLHSSTGREYLYRYLATMWCDEIVMFLQSVFKFKLLITNKERFICAKNIVKVCIQSTAVFAINISYEARTDIIDCISKLEQKFLVKESFEISVEFFAQAEMEVYRLLKQNHWNAFMESIENLQSKSFNVK